MALFCSPCNNSLFSPSPSFTSPAVGHVSTFKPQFTSLPIFSFQKNSNFKPSFLIDLLSQKKPHFPKCSGSSVEEHNNANSTTIIFLKGLAKSTTEGRLKVVFSQFGDVSRVKIITDKKSKQSLGFAYIWFPDDESAQSAVQEMNGKVYTGSDGKAWILQAECQVNTLQVLGNSKLLLASISSLCNATKDTQAWMNSLIRSSQTNLVDNQKELLDANDI